MSSSRSQGRRLALQTLYANEVSASPPASVESLLEMAAPKAPADVLAFAREIVDGIVAQRELLDSRINEALEHWKMDRIHPIERNILRIGLFELTFRADIPAIVSIHEAVDLAHRFGDADAWRFINGVLDHLGKDRLAAEASAHPS
jgi:N utilization substance protein B